MNIDYAIANTLKKIREEKGISPAISRKIKMALAWLCRVSNMYSACSRVFVFCCSTTTIINLKN